MSKVTVTVGDRVAFNYDGLGGSNTKNLLGSGTVYKVEQVVNLFKESGSVIDISIDVDSDLVSSVGKPRITYDIEEIKVIPNTIEGVKRENLDIEIEKLRKIEYDLDNIRVSIGQCDIDEKVELKNDLRDILLKIVNIRYSNKSKNEKRE